MLIWIIGIVLLAMGIAAFLCFPGGDSVALGISGIVALVISITILLCATGAHFDYREFESSFEIQREIYENVAFQDNVLVTADIIKANSELAEYQARRMIYGKLSAIPERVLDIEPIGVGGSYENN